MLGQDTKAATPQVSAVSTHGHRLGDLLLSRDVQTPSLISENAVDLWPFADQGFLLTRLSLHGLSSGLRSKYTGRKMVIVHDSPFELQLV